MSKKILPKPTKFQVKFDKALQPFLEPLLSSTKAIAEYVLQLEARIKKLEESA